MKIRTDFVRETYRLLDQYYDNYTPIRYVRVYGKKRKLHTKSGTTTRKPKAGQVSLYTAITRGGEGAPAIGVAGGSYYDGYIGGVVLDSDQFKRNGMRHIGKGSKFTEWNIVENFMFAGEGGYGDIRSYIDYGYPSADTELGHFMDLYGPTVDRYYKDALRKFK